MKTPFSKFIKFSILASVTILCAIATTYSKKVIAEGHSAKLLQPIEKIELKGNILENVDLSAVGYLGKYLLIGADEGNIIQVLAPNEDGSQYEVINNIELPVPNPEEEIDIEGIAVAGGTVYVIGSHSLNRKTVKPDKKKQKKNLERLLTVENDNNRKNIFEFELNIETGDLKNPAKPKSLQKILEQDDLLSRFTNIPSKENGVDIEGIAAKGKQLYIGFRGPVLRGNYVPVMKVKFNNIDEANKSKLNYLNLNGNGIRDLIKVDDGFLILAGETGDKISPYEIYFWDGTDALPGKDKALGKLELLGEITSTADAKAEGLTVIEETENSYKVLVVFDGVVNGDPTVYEIEKKQ